MYIPLRLYAFQILSQGNKALEEAVPVIDDLLAKNKINNFYCWLGYFDPILKLDIKVVRAALIQLGQVSKDWVKMTDSAVSLTALRMMPVSSAPTPILNRLGINPNICASSLSGIALTAACCSSADIAAEVCIILAKKLDLA